MNCDVIHETVIRDIMDIVHDVKNSEGLKGLRGRGTSFKSIANASSNLTLVFPVVVSRNVSVENAAMVVKAMERKAVSMLQMLFSAMCITDNDNGLDYLSKFHTNLKINDKVTVDGFIDAMDKFVLSNESVTISDIEMYEKAKQDLKNLDFVLPENVNEVSLGDFKVENFFGEEAVVLEKKGGVTVKMDPGSIVVNSSPNVQQPAVHISNVIPSGGNRNGFSGNRTLKDEQEYFKNQILDSDVKKANELMPTMMTVNFITTGDSMEPVSTHMVIGVKAKMYAVDSTDMLNRIIIKNQDKNGLLKLVKATTREISFVRDFLLAIDKAKIDALSQSKRGSSSKLWKILERRALKSKVRRNLGMVNDASAITTMVITQEEVEYLKKTESIDIENPAVIRPIMEAYNLMGFCIVDETIEVCKFIFDTGDDIYESVSFGHLERETNDGGYKKVINMMTKMR